MLIAITANCSTNLLRRYKERKSMKITVKPLFAVVILWLAVNPIAFAQEVTLTPSRQIDISGNWIMKLGPSCEGPLQVTPAPLASAAWTATFTAACGKFSRNGKYSIWADSNGTYHFDGTVTFSDKVAVRSDFDMYWTPDGKALSDLSNRLMHR